MAAAHYDGAMIRRPPPILLLAALLAASVLTAASRAQEPRQPADDDAPRMQGLPPAPPPSGIRSSKPGKPADDGPALRSDLPSRPGPRRATATVFDDALTIEVRDAPQTRADAALRAAFTEIQEIEALVDPDGDPAAGGNLAALNAADGAAPLPVDHRLADLLQRALTFCVWSDRAHGPLGGRLYALWGLRRNAPGRPGGERLGEAARSAACDRLTVDAEAATARLAPGSTADLWGFARGYAVDRAVELLQSQDVDNGLVQLGKVYRAFGRGEDGRGWPVLLPVFPGLDRPLDRVWLRDEALAVSSSVHRPILLGGDRHAPWLDQRSGRPAEGVVGVVTVTELAVDAEALAASLLIMGNREGLLRLGSLRPDPAVLWLLGGGQGTPVMSQHNWSGITLR